MTFFPEAPFDNDGTKRFADLKGIQIDLEDVVKFCDGYLSAYSASQAPDLDQLELFCIAAIVRYG
jgi:hypothetical protein